MPTFLDRARAAVAIGRVLARAVTKLASSSGREDLLRNRGPIDDAAQSLAEAVREATRDKRIPVALDFSASTDVRAQVYSEPSVRTINTWTPQHIRSAITIADSGDLWLAADLCEAILGDDRAPAVLGTRINAVLGSELTFEPGKGRKKRAAVRAVEAEEDWYVIFDEAILGQLLLWGRLLGVAIAQLIWERHPDHGDREICRVEFWHPRHLRWDDREKCWFIKTGDGLIEIRIAPGDGKWIVFTPFGDKRPWSLGLWRGMARLWLLKQYAIDDWGRHSEVHGQPIKVGIPPKVGEPKHGRKNLRKELAEDLAGMAGDPSICLPPGFDFKLVEATARTWEMFKAQIDMANSGMSIMAIGSNLPTEVGNGAATGATAQNLVRLDYKKSDAAALSTMTHDQVLVIWAEVNFGDEGAAPWAIWVVEPAADRKANADILLTFANALDKLTEANAPVDVLALMEEFKVPQRAVDEDMITAAPRVYEYHLKYGIMTRDEARRTLRLRPAPGGDQIPRPVEPISGTRESTDNGQLSVAALGTTQRRARAPEPDGIDPPLFRPFAGIPLFLDRPVGFTQRGIGADGKPWERTYQDDYGFIPGTLGGDGEPLDVFRGAHEKTEAAWWAVQVHPDGTEDELKLLLGYPTEGEARAAFERHIPADRLRELRPATIQEIRAMVGVNPWAAMAARAPTATALLAASRAPGLGPAVSAQRYLDKVVAAGVAAAPAAVAELKQKLDEAIAAATSPADLERRLVALAAEVGDLPEMETLIEGVLLLGIGTGAFTVSEETS